MYAILDIETTGGKFNEEGITEIAIHRFNGREVEDTFISLINPERDIQPYVQKLTGIRPEMVRTAPKFFQVAKRIVEITEGCILVAHNAPFDYRILRTEFRRLGFEFERKTLCTVDLAQRLIPEAESHSLGKLVKALGIPLSNRHRANGDALATLKLFQVLLDRDNGKSILKETIRQETHGELSGRQLRLVEQVPVETGVYYLYSKEGDILYLNASNNMKRDVNRHFTGDGKMPRALSKLTREVRFEATGNELSARLKAYNELKEVRPRFKPRNLRPKGEPPSSLSIGAETYSLHGRDWLLVDRGRDAGERAAFWLKGQELRGFGYYGLNHQINNIHILESLITPMRDPVGGLVLLASYLKRKSVMKVLEI
ncbi:exonuclease domain-containing protein [Robiginitalea sp. M366]|uniref:exonuclease domain-containing protein n=1 Tax=Robiginitalea aestuariiviva TaxID=3036903 RepID=UPI00240D0E50|nr:exonuclease domain-containing protein [Robiginitalea aestuariiviva]MDG1573122.1 exonuclease domain-containing protein [Robiginitalea aestuariiviva]